MNRKLIACLILLVLLSAIDVAHAKKGTPVIFSSDQIKMFEIDGVTVQCGIDESRGIYQSGVMKKNRKGQRFISHKDAIAKLKKKIKLRRMAKGSKAHLKLKKMKRLEKLQTKLCKNWKDGNNGDEGTPKSTVLSFSSMPRAVDRSTDTLTVAFSTSLPTSARIDFSADHGDQKLSVNSTEVRKEHALKLTNLKAGTKYHMYITVTTAANETLKEHFHAKTFVHDTELFHTHHDAIPNYAFQPHTITVEDGDWFSSATWSNGVPDETTNARINHEVVISGDTSGPRSAVVKNLNVFNKLKFGTQGSATLTVGTMIVLGELELGTSEQPIGGFAEIIFRDNSIRPEFDPEAFGHGLVVFEGKITAYGHRNTPYIRVAQAPLAGQSVIAMSEPPVGWLAGDQLYLPDTRVNGTRFTANRYTQGEILTVKAVEGNIVHLQEPIKFDHPGQGEFLPHLANLSGNIVLRSQNPDGTRAHVLATGHSEVDVNDVVFMDLGRTTVEHLDSTHLDKDRNLLHLGTNQIGRYAIHLHHVHGHMRPDNLQMFQITNNVILSAQKWGVVLHGSHYGLVEKNVVFNVGGAGIVTEDGSETGNVIQDNFVGLVHGSGESMTAREMGVDPILVGNGSPEDPFRTHGDHGHEGAGIWARGITNHYLGNVVVNSEFCTLFWARFQGPERIPSKRGADPMHDFIMVDPGLQLGHYFDNFECYGSPIGLELLGLGDGDPEGYKVTNPKIWSVGEAIDASYTHRINLIGARFVGGEHAGIQLGHVRDLDMDDVSIVDFSMGAYVPPGSTVKNSYFHNRGYDLRVYYKGGGVLQTTTHIENVRFGDDSGNIASTWNNEFLNRTYIVPQDVLVYSYNGVAGDDFQLWQTEQAPEYVMPVATPVAAVGFYKSRRLSPVADKTNQELWETYRITAAGKPLPADAEPRQGIRGFVSSIQNDRKGPQVSNVVVTTTRNSATVTFTTDEPAATQGEYGIGDIRLGEYTNLLPANTEMKTQHRVTFSGLSPGTKYNYMIRVVDELGNLDGIGNKSAGANWNTTSFTTKP